MLIKSVKMTNFQCFKASKFNFDSMTFVRGENGVGKTTAGLSAILFALFGYTTKESLKDLPTRLPDYIATSCSVEVAITHLNKEYIVKRAYPTKLTIKENGQTLKLSNTEAQRFINDLFGDRLFFQKFRVIDSNIGANFLEEGQVALKRILFSSSDKFFNDIRIKLNSIKHEREIYNKDNAESFTHYPSEKRLQLISSKLNELDVQETEMIQGIRAFEGERNIIEREMGRLEADKGTIKRKRDKILANKKCYACNQGISESLQKSILTEISQETLKINNAIASKIPELKDIKDIINSQRTVREHISSRIHTLRDLKMKLEARLKLKEYKYTNRDVLIVKKAISELDRLSTYYLTESVRVLEPIINNVLEKINFKVSFETDKNKFAIKLEKDGVIYKYKDLSTGQKLILQIAMKLAILLEKGKTGIIIADEGLSSLDRTNLMHILQIFDNFPFQLIFILHNLDEVPENIKIIDLDKKEE